MTNFLKNNLGYGVGLRRSHYDEVSEASAKMPDWFEIISENYMTYGGTPSQILDLLESKNVQVIPHGVGLSLGSIDPFNSEYIGLLKKLIARLDAPWFSDHLSFSSSNKHQYHDLIPILRNPETIKQIVERIKFIEDTFQKPFAIENISYYGESDHHTFTEVEFINKILKETNAYLLLDINNVYVNSKNLDFSAEDYIDELNTERVIQIHLAGHWDRGDMLIDTHGDWVTNEVWDLYSYFLKKHQREVSTLIEWDHELPSYSDLLKEAEKAKKTAHLALGVFDEK